MNNNTTGRWVLQRKGDDNIDLTKYDAVPFTNGQFTKTVYIPKDADLSQDDLSNIEIIVMKAQWQANYKGIELVLAWKAD